MHQTHSPADILQQIHRQNFGLAQAVDQRTHLLASHQ